MTLPRNQNRNDVTDFFITVILKDFDFPMSHFRLFFDDHREELYNVYKTAYYPTYHVYMKTAYFLWKEGLDVPEIEGLLLL